MPIDMTSFGVPAPNQPAAPQTPRRAMPVGGTSDEFVPSNPKPQTKQGLWDIDSVSKDGQVKAGVPDKAYAEFLKTTTFVE